MARPTFSFEVDMIGLAELRRLMTGNELYAGPWRSGMTRLASQAGLSAQHGAPVATGKLQGSIRAAVQNRPFPLWAAVRVRARRRGYPYPRLLEFSPKHQHREWFLRALRTVWAGADTVLNDIGAQIARKWAAG